MGVISWMAIFQLLVNENEFSNTTDHWNLALSYVMCQFTDTINAIMKVGTRDRDDHLK